MPSPHVIQIFRSKTRLSDEEIIKLTDSQAWKAIYEAEKEERDRRELLRKPEICFTGFNYEERENLETGEGVNVFVMANKKGGIAALGVLVPHQCSNE